MNLSVYILNVLSISISNSIKLLNKEQKKMKSEKEALLWTPKTASIKGTVKEKWKGNRIKSENLRRWTMHIRHLSDVNVSRNWYKTVSKLYENSDLYNFV